VESPIPGRAPVHRYLIVNADDLGLSPGVNRGVMAAHVSGIVTSASLMVRPGAAADAVARSGELPGLDLGLHLDLGEWAYRGGEWARLYEVVPLHDGAAVAYELRRQLDAFRALVGREPTHLDSHQHVHTREPVRSVVAELARELGVPLRHYSPVVRYLGDFYGQTAQGCPLLGALSPEALVAILLVLPGGFTELACHPAEQVEDLDTMYRAERRAELEALCHPRVHAVLAEQDIALCSFAHVAPAAAARRDDARSGDVAPDEVLSAAREFRL
jgi:chitin disaccharide deacetylase